MQNCSYIDFVVLAWNSEAYIASCVESVLGLGELCHKLYVVDNGSTDATSDILTGASVADERLVVLTLCENGGTTSPRNMAIRRILGDPQRAPFVCVLDSDTVANAPALESAVAALRADPSIAVAGPTLVGEDGSEQLSGRNLPTLGIKLAKAWPFGSVSARASEAEVPASSVVGGVQDVGYLISACWVTRTEAWDRVGLLDEVIFYAPEDVDWCLRCHEAGYRVVRVHGSALTHYYQRLSRKRLLSSVNWEHVKGLAHYFRVHGYLFHAPELLAAPADENASGGGRLGADVAEALLLRGRLAALVFPPEPWSHLVLGDSA